jgi:putative transcriptional regulator
MIRFLINELLSEKQFKEGRRITLLEVSEATGINRMTLSKMINHKGYSTVTDNLDKLCNFFGCKVEELIEHIPDESGDTN